MKLLPSLAAGFAALCISCGVAYRAIGVRVDEQGVLREAFALIPLGYLTGTAALLTGTAALITGQKRRRNEEP
jgi:hypothetical protein